MPEKLDAVIFGASGFTGKYAIKEMNRIAKESKDLTWGIAGRSEQKLKATLEEMKGKIGEDLSHVKIILADISDEEALKKMTEQAKVIINCCGPYRFYGEPVIKACIATGTHHVDVSGEPQFMEKMQLEYHKAAMERGIYIVSACGFDSVPNDLGLIYLQEKFDGTLNSVESFLNTKSENTGGAVIHYGTWESAVYGLAHWNELRELRQNLFPERLPVFTPKLKMNFLPHKDEVMGNGWVLPFMGADKSVVYRTQRFLYEHDKKRPVQFAAYFMVKSLINVILLAMMGMLFGFMTKFSIGRSLLLKYPKFFSGGFTSHEGPTEEMMNGTHFSFTFVGKGWSKDKQLPEATDQFNEPPNKIVITKVKGSNPGYGATCFSLVLCATTILKEADKMPNNGGVYPPGAAFAKTSLIDNLHKHGLTFELVSSKEE